MNRGPFGFPRFTSLGPFVDDQTIEKRKDYFDVHGKADPDFNRRLDEIEDIEPDSVSGECVPYATMGSQLEFITPIESTEPLGSIDPTMPHKQIFQAVDSFDVDGYIGIHETDEDNVDSILKDGFSQELSGETSVRKSDFRQNAVYSWHHIWDVNTKGGGIIVNAPREEVVVSDMSASVMVGEDEYFKNYTMRYPQYIRCLRLLGPEHVLKYEEDIIQDLSNYSP